MKLPHEFFRLPLQFDAERLAAEVAGFAEGEWRRHPQGHAGNSAIPLVAVAGDPANDSTRGPMRPTPQLERCAYLQQVLAALGAPIGRTRLMRIAGHGEATAHADVNYYWTQRVRVHIPVLTYPGVRFICGAREVFMDHGECWIFDTWRRHNVLNPDDRPRIHLVVDTVGSESFWRLVEAAEKFSGAGVEHGGAAVEQDGAAEAHGGAGEHLGAATGQPGGPAPRHVPYAPGTPAAPEFERHNFPVVMTPWELESLAASLGADVAAGRPAAVDDSAPTAALAGGPSTLGSVAPDPALAGRPGTPDSSAPNAAPAAAAFGAELAELGRSWRALWARFAAEPAGWPAYRAELARAEQALAPLAGRLAVPNGTDAFFAVQQWILLAALNPDLATVAPEPPAPILHSHTLPLPHPHTVSSPTPPHSPTL